MSRYLKFILHIVRYSHLFAELDHTLWYDCIVLLCKFLNEMWILLEMFDCFFNLIHGLLFLDLEGAPVPPVDYNLY